MFPLLNKQNFDGEDKAKGLLIIIMIIQIKIALSVGKVRILIKILAESHMVFDLGDKIDIW